MVYPNLANPREECHWFEHHYHHLQEMKYCTKLK